MPIGRNTNMWYSKMQIRLYRLIANIWLTSLILLGLKVKLYCTSLWSAILPAAFSTDVLNIWRGVWTLTPRCISTRCRWSCNNLLPFQDLTVDMTWWKTSLLYTVTNVCNYAAAQPNDSAHPFHHTQKIPKWHFTFSALGFPQFHGSWKTLVSLWTA